MTVTESDGSHAGSYADIIGVGRWLRSHLARFKWPIAVYLAGSLAWHALTSTIPLTVGVAFDSLLGARPDLLRFAAVASSLLLVVLLRGIAGVGATYALETVATGLERDIRNDLFAELLRKGQTFFNRRRIGDLSARATGDADAVNRMVAPGIDMALDLLLSIVVPLVFIGFINPWLLVAPGLFVVLFALAMVEHGQRLDPVSGLTRGRFGALNAHVAETIAGMEVVEAANRRQQEQRRFDQLAADYRDAYVQQARTQARYLPPLLLSLALAGALVHSLHLVRVGAITTGELVAYLGLIGTLRAPTQLAAFSLGLIYLGLAGARRILEVINDPTGGDETTGGHAATIAGAVAFDGVTFGYGDTPVLSDISFSVALGTTVALVGPTGSGKSTLLQLLNRTYTPDAGQVLVDGIDVATWDPQSLRSQIAVIEQDVVLFSRSIAENLSFGAAAGVDLPRVEEAARAAHAHEFVAAFKDGYATMLGEGGVTLSGGERQRIAIGRALLADPRILVLDDSTSALDSATEQRIQQAILRVSQGRTTFLISHRLSLIRAADHIVVLDRGRVVGQGSHEELLDGCELYRRIFAPYLHPAPSEAAAARPLPSQRKEVG